MGNCMGRPSRELHVLNANRSPTVHFPIEIWTLVCKNLCQHCQNPSPAPDAYFRGVGQEPSEPSWYSVNRNALFTLCLVSKYLQEIAAPILYHELALGYGDSWRTERYKWEGRFASFLQTISVRPDLAATVRRVYIHPSLFAVLNTDERICLVNRAAGELGIIAPRDWTTKPEEDNSDWNLSRASCQVTSALIKLLLRVPNVEHLSLQLTGSHVFGDLFDVSATRSQLALAKLTRLELSHDTAEWNLADLSRIVSDLSLTAPVLTRLHLHMCGRLWQPEEPGTVPPRLPNLKELRITSSRLDVLTLEFLLSTCTRLETFEYESGPQRIQTCFLNLGIGYHFEPVQVPRVLHRFRGSLRTLKLDLRWLVQIAYVGRTMAEPIGTLKEFEVLENTRLNLGSIYGVRQAEQLVAGCGRTFVELLPPSIVAAEFVGAANDFFRTRFMADMAGLARAASNGEYPHLRVIRCDGVEKLGEQVKAILSQGGINLEFWEYPRAETTIRKCDSVFRPDCKF